MSDETVDWKYATDKLGVSRKTLYAMVRRHELFGERQGNGATAPWVFLKSDVDHLAQHRDHERRMRESGVIVGRGGEFVRRVIDSDEAPQTKAAILAAHERHELLDRVEREMGADAELRKRFERLDDAERFEAQAQELARRIREHERLRARALEILADDDQA